MKNDRVVYIHRVESTGIPFYVGMGNEKRPYEKRRQYSWRNFVKQNKPITIEIVKNNLIESDAIVLEIELIKKYGRIDLGTGTLINETNGGLGHVNLCKEKNEAKSNKMRSYKRSDEVKRKISESNKKVIKDETWRKNISKALKGKKQSKELVEKRTASNKSKECLGVKVSCFDFNTNELIGHFDSIVDASKFVGCNRGSASNNFNNKSKYVRKNKLNKLLIFKSTNAIITMARTYEQTN